MSDARQHLPDVLTETVSETTCVHCGVRLTVDGLPPFADLTCKDCQTVQKVPAKLGHFLLLDLIGTGGMGGVYFAEDLTLGRRVAIKVMLKSLGDNPEFVDTFKREAQAVAKLNHPSIAQIYSFGMEKAQPYIVMELVSGYRFDKMVESHEQLDQGLVARIGHEIAEGLAAASEVGLIHGDIKPENILLDEKLNAKLVDFGLASFKQQATESQVWGTPYYIAPEKIRRKKADERSDIYSLGATLYHALAGKPPFEGDTPMAVVMARLKESPTPLTELRKDISPTLAAIVMRMLEQSPSRRHPTYASLLSDLRGVVKELGADKIDLATISRRTARMRLGKSKTGLITTSLSETSRVLERSTGNIDTDTTLIRKSSNLSESSNEILSQYRKQTLIEDSAPAKRVNKLAIILTIVGILVVAGAVGAGIFVTQKIKETERIEAEARKLVDMKQQVTQGLTEIRAKLTKAEVAFETTSALADKATDLQNRLQVLVDGMNADSDFDVHTPAQQVRDAAVKADERWAEAKSVSEAVDAVEEQARGATELAVVTAAKQQLSTLNYQLRAMEDEDEKAGLGDPAAAYAELQLLEGAIIEKKAEYDRLQATQKRQDQLTKLQEAERAKIELEVKQVEDAISGAKPLVAQRRYRAAASKLTLLQSKFKTVPAQVKLRVEIDRLQRVDDLLKFVIDGLHSGVTKSIYFHPRYNVYVDILDADVNGITGNANTSVAWADVTDRQMKRFIDHFVMDEKLPLTVRAEQSVNAAIFCDMMGNKSASNQYATRAASLRRTLQKEIDRLIPKEASVEAAIPDEAIGEASLVVEE